MIWLRGESNLPWMCIWDFNEVLRREEHVGPNERDVSHMGGFRNVVDLCGLESWWYRLHQCGLDLREKSQRWEYCPVRLDKALATSSWSSIFPLALVCHLLTAKSDHSPIVLCNEVEAAKRRLAVDRSFRYEAMWHTHPEFLAMVERAL